MRIALTTLFFLVSLATAQTTLVVAPNPPAPTNLDRPFAGGVGRYQQWYAPWSLSSGFLKPVRIDRLEFFAGLTQSSNATAIDMELSIGYGQPTGLFGSYGSNFSSTPLVVWPRQNLQLAAGSPGAVVLTVPFQQQFTWDRTRPIVIDIKVFGNSRSNQPFTYNNLGTVTSFGATSRLYQAGNPFALSGQVQQSMGMITQFRGRAGAVLQYGTGCPGEGGFVPENTVLQLPWPAITWSHRITKAASQRSCIWMIGDSNTMNGGVSLPIDLGTMFGRPPTGCLLLQNALVTLWTTSIGGGPGAGMATVSVNLPLVTGSAGTAFYTQWFVLDPHAPNGFLSATEGEWSIVAPYGG